MISVPMKIIQISDLHITKDSTLRQYSQKISCLIETINKEIPQGAQLLILICGDLIDKGDPSGYQVAGEVLNAIEDGLLNYTVEFEFTPGNHEINENLASKLEEFGTFLEKIKKSPAISNSSVLVKEYEGINFVIINTCFLFNKEYGEVDIPKIEETLKTLNGPIVWFAHHTLFSRYGGDGSAIRNSHALIECIISRNSIAYIHGHTHGYSDITIGKKCKVVGVGPLFKKLEDVNNQFNILTISGTQLIRIDNFGYRADTNSFVKQTLYENQKTNYFEGSSLINLYGEAVTNVKASNVVNNFHFELSCSLNNFQKEVESEFCREIELAKLWIDDTLPDEMYYNHAQFMNKGEKNGIDYIIEELSRKSTSSRAIIPLINMLDVVNSGDRYLPSLDVIQFGFDDDTKARLRLTVYMRALEVNHFLKINISEMYHLINTVCDNFRSVQWLDINIVAFRAQYKERFGCFMKARIDAVSPHKMTAIVMKKDIDNLISMLEEKKSLSETVVNADGINSLASALLETVDDGKYEYYTRELIEESKRLVRSYEALIGSRKRTSIHTEIERIEREIIDILDKIVVLLKIIKERE